MTSNSARTLLSNASTSLLSANLAISANLHKIIPLGKNTVRVSWSTDRRSLSEFDDGSLSEYLDLLRNQQFSIVLNDGSLLQMSYDFLQEELIRHRLAYIPCPISLTFAELNELELTIEDFVEMISVEDVRTRLRSRPYLRFDFDSSAPDTEPFSHVHTSFANSRVPVCGPLSMTQFLSFILENFYPETAAESAKILPLHEVPYPHKIREHHKSRLHFTWMRTGDLKQR